MKETLWIEKSEDKYLSYELLMLMELLRIHKGKFVMRDDGDWDACIGQYQFRGRWDSLCFRTAYSFLMMKVEWNE